VCRRWFADDRVLARIRIRNFGHVGIQDALAGVQTGATVKARPPKTSRIKPSDLQEQAEKLIREGRMPGLNQLLAAIDETRRKYGPKILEARRQARIHTMRKAL
jgi:hypothetical protein